MSRISDVNEVWKWSATTLAGFMLGAFGMSLSVGARVNAHERMTGHPVLELRVDTVESDIAEIKDLLKSLNDKMDRIHPQGGGDAG